MRRTLGGADQCRVNDHSTAGRSTPGCRTSRGALPSEACYGSVSSARSRSSKDGRPLTAGQRPAPRPARPAHPQRGPRCRGGSGWWTPYGARHRRRPRCTCCTSTSPTCAGPLPDEVLVTAPPGYLLRVPTGAVDLADFERLLARGREALSAGDPAGCGDVAGRGVGAVARPRVRRPRRRGIRSGGGSAAGGAAAGRPRAADHGRPGAR
jgi:hypothetical protein